MAEPVLVGAIDFGTTYSGWAFSFRHEFLTDPTKISAKQWLDGNHVSLKAPTTVLIKPDGQTLEAFGYEAEKRYGQLAVEDLHQSYYYFKCFKMMLYGKLGLTRDIMLEDDKDQKLPAKTVFSLAIKFLKDDLIKVCSPRVKQGLADDSIHWVLTVPAIWDDAAKQFMREAAELAGIKSSQLSIALEPEAASLFCRHIPVQQIVDDDASKSIVSFSEGSKYMVLDAGGGTVDITIHEVLADGKLRELHKATGGDWGGTKVDHAFKQMLYKLFSLPVTRAFQRKHTDDYLDLMRDFEIKKRDITPKSSAKVTLKLPTALIQLFKDETDEEVQDAIKQTNYADKMVFSTDKLRIDVSVYKEMFAEAITGTVEHIRGLFSDDELSETSTILMVGGFSESSMLQGAIKDHFPKTRLIIPEEAGLVVLKGAVVFGHRPSAIDKRISRHTYGVELNTLFEEGTHDKSKRFESGGRFFCKHVFDKHVEIGQPLKYGEPQSKRTYAPLTASQDSIDVNVYASNEKEPKYVTDAGCRQIGKVTVKVRDMKVPMIQRTILVTLTFSGTEIEVAAKEKNTGKVTSCKANFLG